MSSPTTIKAGYYIRDATDTVVGTPLLLGYTGNGISFHNSWNVPSGDLAGTLLFEASNDPEIDRIIQDGSLTTTAKATALDAAQWVDVTSTASATDPTTGIGNDMVVMNDTRYWWIRMTFTRSGGIGAFSSYTATHGDG